MDEWNAIQPDWDAAKAEVARATQAMTLAWEALFDALSGEYERLSGRLAGATPARRVSIQDAMNQVRLRVNELQRDQSRIRVPIIRTSWISHQPIDTPDITAFKKARLRGQIEQIDEDIERTSAERDRLERIQRGEDALARVNRDMFDSHVSAAGPPRAGDATSPIPNQPPGETNFEELSTAERLGTVRLYLDALVEFRASLDEELRRFPPGIGEGA
jgi:hypothetical protein